MQYSFKLLRSESADSAPMQLNGPAAQSINFGGSSFGFSFVLPDGNVKQFCEGNWRGYFSELDRGDVLETIPMWDSESRSQGEINAAKRSSVFSEIAAQMIVEAAKVHGLSPEMIRRIGVTTPGVIDKSRNVILNSNNIPFADIEGFNLLSEIHNSMIEIDPAWDFPVDFRMLNDAEAGVLGELAHPEGYLTHAHGQGVAIDGTGFGGQLLINGEVSQKYKEFGYVLIRCEEKSTNENPYYEFQTLEQTFEYYHTKSIDPLRTQLPGKRFLETVAGGKWAAVYYLNQIRNEGLMDSLFDVDPTLNIEEINCILELSRDDELHWDTTQLESTINHLGILRVQLGQNKASGDAKLVNLSRQFDLQLAREIGSAFKALNLALREEFSMDPDEIRIALVSSVFEGHRDDEQWLSIIRKVSGLKHLEVSSLSQNVREAFPHGADLKHVLRS